MSTTRTMVSAVALTAMLGACASTPPLTYREKPGGTADSFNKDRYECIKEARTPQSSWGYSSYGQGAGANGHSAIVVDENMVTACLEGHGYHKVAKPVKG